jgi:hypothetical protein
MNYSLWQQEQLESGGTRFCLPGFARIPEWSDHPNMGQKISFWFRNNLPSIALCFSTKLAAKTQSNCYIEIPTLIINGKKCPRHQKMLLMVMMFLMMKTDHHSQ